MGMRTVEQVVQTDGEGSELRLRVDLHGVSVTGPGDARTVIRWEWIESIEVADGVDVRSAKARVHVPAGAFGCSPERLCTLLDEVRALERRPDVIEELSTAC